MCARTRRNNRLMDCKNTKTTERDLIVSHRLVNMVRRLNDRARCHKITNIATLCTNIKYFLMTSQIQHFLSYLVNMILTSFYYQFISFTLMSLTSIHYIFAMPHCMSSQISSFLRRLHV